ncbi:MAG: ComEC/Rec2 family competence protein, partial [Muribaculaceae bacterium]|nr:ComEC/Rec2 family competence protein [Muribaculaceae bacterium]
VCRAAVMALVMLGCGLFETPPDPRQALAVSVTVCLLLKPMWLYAPGFQMSVVAVTGLLVFGRMTGRIPVRKRLLRFILDLLVIPVFALVSTAALTLFYFHTLPLNFWLANITAALFVPLILGTGFVTVLLGLIGLPAMLLAGLTDVLCRAMNGLVASVDSVGLSPLTVFLGDLEIGLIVLAVAALGWVCLRPGRISGVTATVAVIAAICVIAVTDREIPAAELYVPRHAWSTDIILADGGRVFVWNVSRHGDSDLHEMLDRNYRDFFRHRGVSAPEALPDSYSGRNIKRDGEVVTIGQTAVGVIRSDTTAPGRHLHYALLSGDYKGSIDRLCQYVDADTVLIPRQMHHRRAKKLMSRLTELGKPARRLTDRPLAIIID